MAKKKRGQDQTSGIPQISFYSEDKTLITEYIPKELVNFEYRYRFNLRKIQNRFNTLHYYWQYRHLLSPELRKVADLQFLTHVYQDHGGRPEDWWERRHYAFAWSLYGSEFLNLIVPKLQLEKENKAIIHPYAQVYYKRWLKKSNPQMKQFYHGVKSYETIELLDIMINTEDKSSKRYNWRKQYHNSKVKKSKE